MKNFIRMALGGTLFVLLIGANTYVSLGQMATGSLHGKPIEYSKLFDTYYRKGPLKFALEPGPTFLMGDLKAKRMNFGLGVSGNYTINGPVDLVVGLRYFGLSSDENGVSTSTSFYQLNALGRLYLRYNRVRTQRDRRKKPKFWRLFVTSGINISRYSASASSGGSFGGFRINAPVGVGIPFRISDRVSIVPEAQFYYTLSDKIDALSTTSANDRFLVASIGIEFNPSGKRKHPKRVHLEEGEEGEGGDGGGSGGDGDDDMDEEFDDSEEMENDSDDPAPAPTPVDDNNTDEEDEGEDEDEFEDDTNDDDTSDDPDDDSDDDGSDDDVDWGDDGW